MKIYTKRVFQMNPDGSYTELHSESFNYTGAISQAFGGRSRSSSQQTTDIDTTQVGIESVEGLGIAAAGDVDFNQNITQTDFGAVESSFEFAGEFGERGFNFASDIARQAGETAQQAVETSRQAIATVATGGASDLAGINQKTIAVIAAAVAAVFIVPQLLKRSA